MLPVFQKAHMQYTKTYDFQSCIVFNEFLYLWFSIPVLVGAIFFSFQNWLFMCKTKLQNLQNYYTVVFSKQAI